MMEFLSN